MKRTFRVVFKTSTALAPELVDADAATLALGEGLLLFEPTWVDGTYHRPPPIPLRFLHSVTQQDTGLVVYLDRAAHEP